MGTGIQVDFGERKIKNTGPSGSQTTKDVLTDPTQISNFDPKRCESQDNAERIAATERPLETLTIQEKVARLDPETLSYLQE